MALSRLFCADKRNNMGTFGIFVTIVTFIFVIYYMVMISMDLFGTKGEKKESAEVIRTVTQSGLVDATPTASPVRISETGEGKYQIERPGESEPERFGNGKQAEGGMGIHTEVPAPTNKTLTAEDIAGSDEEGLASEAKAKAEAISQGFSTVSPEIQGAVHVDEYIEDCKAARMKACMEDEEAEKLSL